MITIFIYEEKNLVKYCSILAGAIGAAALVYTIVKTIVKKKHVYPPNIVVLHQPWRTRNAPSLSPFCLKLETFLRLTNIPYINVFDFKKSPKGKVPWIEYNGSVISDSQFCIEYLNKEFGVNLNARLSTEDLAVSRAFTKLSEESLMWSTAVMERWVFLDNLKWCFGILGKKFYLIPFVHRVKKRISLDRGIGHLTREQVYKVGRDNLTAVSNFLGDKKYLFGDDPSEADCFIFGLLCQLLYTMPGSVSATLINDELVNLKEFCERMKMKAWPDWKLCVTNSYWF